MSHLNRNERDFYKTTGFEIGNSISTLSDNFKENLGQSNVTDFDWGSSPDNMWQEEQSTTIKIETIPGCTLEVFEIVGTCSFMEVRSTEYVRVDTCDGTTNETIVPIPDYTVNLTYRRDILTPLRDDNIIGEYRAGAAKNNAFEVVATPHPFALNVEKLLKKLGW